MSWIGSFSQSERTIRVKNLYWSKEILLEGLERDEKVEGKNVYTNDCETTPSYLPLRGEGIILPLLQGEGWGEVVEYEIAKEFGSEFISDGLASM